MKLMMVGHESREIDDFWDREPYPIITIDFPLGAQNCERIPKTRVSRFLLFYPLIQSLRAFRRAGFLDAMVRGCDGAMARWCSSVAVQRCNDAAVQWVSAKVGSFEVRCYGSICKIVLATEGRKLFLKKVSRNCKRSC